MRGVLLVLCGFFQREVAGGPGADSRCFNCCCGSPRAGVFPVKDLHLLWSCCSEFKLILLGLGV